LKGTRLLEILFKGRSGSLLWIAVRYLASVFSYVSGVAGGIFAPYLATGVTRTPFTSFILVVEMTDRHSAIFPMMICAVVANNAARMVSERGFYEVIKESYLAGSQRSEQL
jgi:H+/Cl- antiporter ClcA